MHLCCRALSKLRHAWLYVGMVCLLNACSSMNELTARHEIAVGMPKTTVASKSLWSALPSEDPWLWGCFYEYFPRQQCEIVAGSGRKNFLVFCGVRNRSDCNGMRDGNELLNGIYPNYYQARNSLENQSTAQSQTITQESSLSAANSKAELLKIEQERHRLAKERSRLEAEKVNREKAKQAGRLTMSVSDTPPDSNGVVTIRIQTNVDTSSLKINGDELGGKADGKYEVKRVARVAQVTRFTLVATDIYGNSDSKVISVERKTIEANHTFKPLNVAQVKQQQPSEAVAIIMGIEKYKRVSKADYANADALDFYDYAMRALGIRAENIKLLVDEGADDVEILRTFQNWLPLKSKKGKTDVYVFFSGHGLPSQDGQSLFLLPWGVDKDFVDKTAINMQELVDALQAAQPKTVTLFIDSCYSGQSRNGQFLLSSARPIALKVAQRTFPANFTVLSASAPDQLSSSSVDLKHGIFSYYLMKGMEGEADLNEDGKITVGEMQEYLQDMVSRQAMTMNRKQHSQSQGDPDKVLVAK